MMGGNYKMQTLKNSIHYVAASKDEEILKIARQEEFLVK